MHHLCANQGCTVVAIGLRVSVLEKIAWTLRINPASIALEAMLAG
jgi:hypothetical protein